MDGKGETRDEELLAGTSTQTKEGNSSKVKDMNNEELHERDLEGLSKKARKEWKDYAKSQMLPMLEKPKSTGSTESPLRRLMEELRLDKPDNDRKSGTSKTPATSGNPNTSHSGSTKKTNLKRKTKNLRKTRMKAQKRKIQKQLGGLRTQQGP